MDYNQVGSKYINAVIELKVIVNMNFYKMDPFPYQDNINIQNKTLRTYTFRMSLCVVLGMLYWCIVVNIVCVV
jgi:uncharacterized membrane-anchored protein